ncbi:MAG: ABC transporter substrate-binding protein [Acidimicrobiia bacterium]
MRPRSPRSFLLAAVVLVAAGCAGGGAERPAQAPLTAATEQTTTTQAPTTTEAVAFPVTIKTGAGEVTVEERPERVVSLSPTATEMLFALGAGGQVVATDDFSNYPAEAQVTEKLGSGFEVNVEAVAAAEPDLVVLSFESGEVVESFRALGIPALLHPAAETLEDTHAQIEQLGAATGHGAEATELVAGMQAEIEEIASEVPEPPQPLTYYHELTTNLDSVTSATFIGQIYGLVGLRSIADETTGAGPYPQLSAEFIIESDPDLIFLADVQCCGVTAQTIAERPGWGTLTAVEQARVVELDGDVASRWGPRVVDFLRTVANEVAGALEPAG